MPLYPACLRARYRVHRSCERWKSSLSWRTEARGAYAGAIGYLGFSGNLNTCITIRTIIFKNGKAYVQAGAGIVHDSVPENEYEETVNKAKAMLKAIRTGRSNFPACIVSKRDRYITNYEITSVIGGGIMEWTEIHDQTAIAQSEEGGIAG